jgi:hypothetical protein
MEMAIKQSTRFFNIVINIYYIINDSQRQSFNRMGYFWFEGSFNFYFFNWFPPHYLIFKNK